MKKLSKTLLAISAVSAVSMAMAASAMAMTATYADGDVTLGEVNATGDSQTLLVVTGEGTDVTSENANEVVVQIDQKDDGTSFATVPVGDLADGTYEVRIGGSDGTMQKVTFTVGETSPEEITIIIGDANGDERVEMLDASAVASYSVGTTTADNANVNNLYNVVEGIDGVETIRIGDATLDGMVEMLDASAIASYSVGTTTADNANVNTTVTVGTAVAE